ncbi:MAG: hypothetical protein DDT37_00518 [Firmicutes bacterium]|nr:hypothetical protein [candidate division NPL-UPA2 bacterium]MBT9155551.1 hypothetical protein [candidate division NPL-UPA2 bacterium]
MTLGIALLVTAALGLMACVGVRVWFAWRHRVSLRLKGYSLEGRTERPGVGKGGSKAFVSRVFLARFALRQLALRYEPVLERAGIPLRGEEMAGAIGLSAVVGLILGVVLAGAVGGLCGGIVGYLAPGYVLKAHLAKRLRLAEEQLGDFLIFAANAMRAGNSLMQALELAGRDLAPPISTEMRRTLREISLGVNMDDAWQNLVARLPSADMDLVATAVLIQRQVGGDLASVLDSIAATIRERQRMTAQVRTLTAQGRLSGIVIALLPFLLFALFSVINLEYVRLLWTEPLGLMMLGMGLVSQVLGMVVISRIIRIDV